MTLVLGSVVSGQRFCILLVHGAGRLSFSLFKRFRTANLPLLIAFVGAFIMFIRALSGAGYEPVDTSSFPRLQDNTTSSFWNTHMPIGESRWARLRSGVADTLWRCPGLTEEQSNSTQSEIPYTPGCLKAKLQNVVRSSGNSLLGGKGIAKDSTNFEVPILPSLLSSPFPSSFSNSSPQQNSPEADGRLPPPSSTSMSSSPREEDDSDANVHGMPENEDTGGVREDETRQVMEEERPRANLQGKHGFEVRRKPH